MRDSLESLFVVKNLIGLEGTTQIKAFIESGDSERIIHVVPYPPEGKLAVEEPPRKSVTVGDFTLAYKTSAGRIFRIYSRTPAGLLGLVKDPEVGHVYKLDELRYKPLD